MCKKKYLNKIVEELKHFIITHGQKNIWYLKIIQQNYVTKSTMQYKKNIYHITSNKKETKEKKRGGGMT